ncbi:hypothetical protein RZS08_42875, partial [Arthrospira platensis SPKY1]|nr:hypothetical protein [Arthrospira platensis SPKY1]
APRLLAARVRRATAIDIRPGIDRVMQHVAQRGSIRPAPVQIALAQAHSHPVGELNLVADQVLQHPIDRPAPLELVENQRDRGPCLFVGLQDHLPRRPAHVAHRHGHPQLAAFGLGPLAGHHPLLEHMRFR